MATNDPIRFSFDERKTAAAAALIVKLAGGSMDYIQLIKLLYFADRESLDALGRPISGDRYVSMRHGPVLSAVYDLVKQSTFGRPKAGPWSQQLASSGRYTVRLVNKEIDLGPLSEAEIEVITQVVERYRSRDKWGIRDEAHELPEWEDPGKSSHEIAVETILEVLGKTEGEIKEIREAAKERAHFNSIFGR